MRIVSEANRSVLLVREIGPQHAGEFTCRAENVAGSVTCTATLAVCDVQWEETTELLSPNFIQPIQSQKVMDGQRVLFTCQVTGKPTPQVTWYHNEQPVREAKDVTIFQDSEGVCYLSIFEVFPEDAGEYTCTAVNRMGEAVSTAPLIVEAYEYVPDSEIASGLVTGQSESEEDLLDDKIIKIKEKSPTFIKTLEETTLIEDGKQIRLKIRADGQPKPKITWFKSGSEIMPSSDFIIDEFDDGTSVLTIAEVYPDDAGEIVVVAENPLGVVTSTTFLETTGKYQFQPVILIWLPFLVFLFITLKIHFQVS